jgi:hypothetical protein
MFAVTVIERVAAPAGLAHSPLANLKMNHRELAARFANNLLNALCNKGLISQEIVDNMNSWEHSGFNVHIGDPIPYADNSQLLFVIRYLRSCTVTD